MNTETFDNFYKGSLVRCVFNHAIIGEIVDLAPDGCVVIVTCDDKRYQFPLDNLEFC